MQALARFADFLRQLFKADKPCGKPDCNAANIRGANCKAVATRLSLALSTITAAGRLAFC